jgi:hypothetical protein
VRRVEQRVTGEFLMVQGPAGIVVSIAGWILDRVICAEMTIGTRRVDLAALIELRRLLMGVSNPTHPRIDLESFGRKATQSLKLPAAVPGRQTNLQSTQSQVMTNLESKRRQ